jgi:hypothetical protein
MASYDVASDTNPLGPYQVVLAVRGRAHREPGTRKYCTPRHRRASQTIVFLVTLRRPLRRGERYLPGLTSGCSAAATACFAARDSMTASTAATAAARSLLAGLSSTAVPRT